MWEVAAERETQKIDLTGCARCCDADHEDLVFERLDQPMVSGTDGTTWEWWATCPTSGQPILMRTEKAEDQVFACRRG